MTAAEAATDRHGDFLFQMWDGGGNVPPVLSLGRKLVERGHRARVLAPSTLEGRIRAAGLGFRPFAQARDRVAEAGRAFEDQPMPLLAELFVGLPPAQDLLAEIEREPPDVVVVDFMLGGALAAAERSRLPRVAFVHTLLAFLDTFEGMISMGLPILNATRAAVGLPPIDPAAGPVIGQMLDRCSLVMVTTARALDRPPQVPTGAVRYVGPQPDATPADGPPLPWPHSHPDPLVLVSLSTSYQHQERVLDEIVVGLGGLPVRAVVTLGHELEPDGVVTPPPNVAVRRWIPHTTLLPETSAVVTHAGHGTVIAALSHGVPLVCLPMGRDQDTNAQRVAEIGCGRVLPATANAAEIAEALTDVLATPRYRRAAAQMASTIRQEGAASLSAVRELESLL